MRTKSYRGFADEMHITEEEALAYYLANGLDRHTRMELGVFRRFISKARESGRFE